MIIIPGQHVPGVPVGVHAYKRWYCRCPDCTEANRAAKQRDNESPSGIVRTCAECGSRAETTRGRERRMKAKGRPYLCSMPCQQAARVRSRYGGAT